MNEFLTWHRQWHCWVRKESCLFPWLSVKQGLTPSLLSIYLALLCLCCCLWTISSCGEQALLATGNTQASHCGGFPCCGAGALSACASAIVLRLSGVGDRPGPRIQLMTPALPLDHQASLLFPVLLLPTSSEHTSCRTRLEANNAK